MSPTLDTGGGGRGSVPGPSAGVNAGAVPALGALVCDSTGGGEEVGGDTSSFGGVEAEGVLNAGGLWPSGVSGPEDTGGTAGSSEGGAED